MGRCGGGEEVNVGLDVTWGAAGCGGCEGAVAALMADFVGRVWWELGHVWTWLS